MPSASQDISTAVFDPLRQCHDHDSITRAARDLPGAPQDAECKAPARAGAYPSPPMSGSPLSQKAASDASERTHPSTGYPTSIPQDVFRASSAQPSPTESQPSQGYPSTHDPYSRPYPHEPAEKMSHGYPQPADYPPRPLSYPSQPLPGVSQAVPPHPYMSSTESPSASGYPLTRPSPAEGQPFTSPKSQRKAKGHVASACVPCKRAHLRCDAQRPCSRCLSNGKEDACVDVQHKKRGRPRLRDDREARYDLSRPPPPPETTMRRPLSMYGPGGPGYEAPHEMPPQRVLKPQPSEPLAPRYAERSSAREPGPYSSGLSVATQPSEPAAYLNLNLEFSKASESFLEIVGGYRNRRYLEEVVASSDRDKVITLKNQVLAEQKQREPNYLPPILGRGDQVLQGLGFGTSDISRFPLNRHDYLAFVAADGQTRVYPVRLGLAKEGSFFFVVLVLAVSRPAYGPTSPHERAPPPFYTQPPQPPPQTSFGGPPGSMAHDLSRHRLSEGPLPARPQMHPGHSSGPGPMGPGPYSSMSGRPEYPGPSSFHTPRSGLPHESQPPYRPSYQLPPIRAPPEKDGPGSGGDRSSRVDIGGLIEKPEAPGRPH